MFVQCKKVRHRRAHVAEVLPTNYRARPVSRAGETTEGGETMKNFMRRIAVIVGATAVSVGLMSAAAAPAEAAAQVARDSSWGW